MIDVSEVLAEHGHATRPFRAAGVRSALLEQGPAGGIPVLCVHGVPASSFLYRKVIPELAARGLRGLAFDLPGLGLAERPADFDYSWSGLGKFAADAVRELGLERFHLVVHDIGGPVGFELAAREPARVASLTLLNTIVDVAGFRRPWVMEPFARRGIGPLWLDGMPSRLFVSIMRRIGVWRQDAVTDAELAAYVPLLRGDDRGRAFLRVMRGFEPTPANQRRYREVVGAPDRPTQVLWGAHDPALPEATHGRAAAEAAGVRLRRLDGRHFLQEDNAGPIADAVAALARSSTRH